MAIVNYIKIKYLGATIEYKWLPKTSSRMFSFFSRDDNKDVETRKGTVQQVIIGQDAYYLLLDNGDKVMIAFEASVSKYGLSKKVQPTNRELQMEVLRNQQYLNQSLAAIGDSNTGFSTDLSPLLGSMPSMENIVSGETDYDSGEEIIYTDLKTGDKAKGIANATLDGVFLVGGSQVKLNFVGKDE